MKHKNVNKIIALLIVFIITFTSCEDKDVTKNSENIKFTVDNQRFLDTSKSGSFGDPFEIDKVLKEENMLYIDVKYGGGCQEHNFEVIWGGDLIKTNPPSIRIVLVHDGNNDMCEAYLSERLKINLKELMGKEYTDLWNVYVTNTYKRVL